MNDRAEITTRLANRLKEERAAKGLSLDALAKLSGVSRSMLSQIERGDSSPTVATLWNLTRALQVDFAGLLDDNGTESNIREILRARQTPTIEIRGEGCRIRILSPPDQAGRVEVYEIWFAEDGALVSDPHRQGCVEHLTVLEGTLHVTAGEDAAELSRDDTLRYCADCNHAIRAVGGPARALLIVHNS